MNMEDDRYLIQQYKGHEGRAKAASNRANNKIQHVIIIFKENHCFDNTLARFPV